MIGGKVIKIDGDNIVIDDNDDDEVYVGTPGLWTKFLKITMKEIWSDKRS